MKGMYSLATGIVALAASSLMFVASSHAENVYPGKWAGSWSVGLFLDTTDCDTEEIRFLKDEVSGLIKVFPTKKTINRIRTEYVKTNGLGRSWETVKSTFVTNKKFRGISNKSSGGALVKETLKISNVRRNVGEITLKGTVSYKGERCRYEYYGSISRS